jgi:hypothetical protein
MGVEAEPLKFVCEGFNLKVGCFPLTLRFQSRSRNTRRLARVLAIALPLLLGMMVLVWGTGYKVSLYKVKTEANASVPAKLCTRSSDIAKSDADTAIADHGVIQAQILFAMLSFSDSESKIARPISSRTDFVLTPPSFRPTPSVHRRPPPAKPHLLLA